MDMDTKCEDIVSHAHHKTSTMEAALDNQEDQITSPTDVCQAAHVISGLA